MSGHRRLNRLLCLRGDCHDEDLVHPRVQALADVSRGVGLAGLDLEGDPLAATRGQQVDRFAATDRGFFGDGIALCPEMLGQELAPIPMLYTTMTI